MIEQQFTAIKADIYKILQQNVQRTNAQVTTTPLPGASATTVTPPTLTEDTKLHYFVARTELSKKCETFKYSFTPKEVDVFFTDHLTATTTQCPRVWQTQLVIELKHKLDTEWRALSIFWN